MGFWGFGVFKYIFGQTHRVLAQDDSPTNLDGFCGSNTYPMFEPSLSIKMNVLPFYVFIHPCLD